MGVLSHDERRTYEMDGFLVFDPALPTDLLDDLMRSLAPHWTDSFEENRDTRAATRIQDAWKFSEPVRTVATWPRVMEALQELYGRRPLPFQTLNFPVGTEQRAHSDTIHFNSMPAGFMCGVWVALEDIDAGNGALVYYPGSHKLPEYTLRDFAQPPAFEPAHGEEFAREHYPSYEEFIATVIRDFKLGPAEGHMKRGQAAIWAANLLHGGGPRRDRHRTRHSQVTHYFFENCRYYTPMFTQGTKIFERTPEWITPPERKWR